MADWQFVIGPATGGHVLALTEAHSRSVTWRLTAPSEAGFTIDGRHEQAAAVGELTTDLHVIRDHELLYRGRVGATGDDLDADSHDTTVASLDYREVLNRRILWSDSMLTWTGQDQAKIMADLLDATQKLAGGQLGIVAPATETGVTRDRTYEPGDSIGQRMQELSEVIDGFDWDIVPTDASSLSLQLFFSQRGVDRGVVLEYGGKLVASVQRQVDPSTYADAVRVTGDEGAATPPTPVEVRAPDIGTRPEGRWDATVGTTVTVQSQLNERADWELQDAQTLIPTYTVKLAAGAWQGPSHIWLGDTVQLVIMSGRLAVDVKLRVSEVKVDVDDDGAETVTLTIGRPNTTLYRKIPLMLRRLRDLERR